MEKIYFLIASYGRTATYWLASSLHKHRDIACSHGATLSDFCMNYESPDVPDAKVLLSHKELDEFRKKSVDDFFDLLETKKKVKIYGNVHGYSAGDIWLMNSRHRIKRDIRVVNLMRHPITRIESLKRRFVYEFSFNPYLRKRVEEHFKKIVSSNLIEYVRNSFKVDLSHEANRLFLYSLSLVPLLDSEDMQTPYLQIPIERLVKDKECFCWVFNYLTKAGAPITKDYLDSVFSVNRMNSLNEESTSIEQFNSWDVWMRSAFKILMLEYNFPVIYKQMNYDFSFVGSIEPEIADLIRSGRKTFVTNMSEPVLIEEGYKGYNIVKFGKKYYGLAQEIGEIDFMQISQKALSCYCDLGKCFIESSIPAVKEKVNFVVINGIKAGKNHRE